MAVWQYTIIFIPSTNFETNLLSFNNQKSTEYLKETFCFWRNTELNLDKIISKIDLLIPDKKSKNQNSIYWKGNIEECEDNDCSIFFENNKIYEFTIRFDLRKIENIKKFVDSIINIANENNLMLMNLKYDFFLPKKEIFVNDILNSNGIKFLENPNQFLDNL